VFSASRCSAVFGVIVAALVLPNTALAHAGKSAPIATNFEAHISGINPASDAVDAKVIDGDGSLWLRVRDGTTVVIPGAGGEPLLRFDREGVFVNLRSLTAQSDRIDQYDVRPDPNWQARPLWHRLSSGHAFLWHEHRLHALEPLARGHSTRSVLGRWSVPLLIDGQRHSLEGVLVYRPPGSAWPWILLILALAAVSAFTLTLTPATGRRVALGSALTATLLVWAVRIGRELYGRPSLAITGYFEIMLTSLVGIALLYGLLHSDRSVRTFTALLVGFGCLYQSLTTFAVLTHAVALTVLPTLFVRISVAAILGLGAGTLAIAIRDHLSDSATGETGDREANEPGQEPQTIHRPSPALDRQRRA
jgi:hypothetical protein